MAKPPNPLQGELKMAEATASAATNMKLFGVSIEQAAASLIALHKVLQATEDRWKQKA